LFIYLFKIKIVHVVHRKIIKATVKQQKTNEKPVKLKRNDPSQPTLNMVSVSYYAHGKC